MEKDEKDSTHAKPGVRLLSIDTLRGLDMFFIAGLGTTLAAFGLWTDTEWGVGLAGQMKHAGGIGLTLMDCVFPIFLFLAGVSWPFSCAASEARGSTKGQLVRKILVRAILLVLLGYIHDRVLSFKWEQQRMWPVISRIGLAWGFAALTYLFFGLRTRIVTAIAIFAGYWAVMRFVHAPGVPESVNPLVEHKSSIAWWLDINYLTVRRLHEGGFATIPMLAHAMLGVFAGSYLRRRDIPDVRQTAMMFAGAGCLLAAGFAIMPFCPCIKGIWTPTYAFITTGIGLFFLAAFHWIIDVKGWSWWAFPMIVVGMNSITIYMLRAIVKFSDISIFFLGGVASLVSPEFSKVIISAGSMVLSWLVLLFLYRKKVFLRV